MKGLTILCHPNLKDYLLNMAGMRFPKLKKSAIRLISSQSDFDLLNGETFVSKGQLWIHVELGWEKTLYHQGYSLALELIQNTLEQEQLEIIFFSIASRKTLLSITNDERNIFPKAFAHVQLPIENVKEVNPIKFGGSSFLFIKNYALSRSNIIGDCIHRLENIQTGGKTLENLKELTYRLSSIKDVLTPEINSIINSDNVESIDTTDLLEKLRSHKQGLADDEVVPKRNQRNRKIIRTAIILEDNTDIGNLIKSEIEQYCSDCFYYQTSAEALSKIKVYNSTLDILICDLELLDGDNFWQLNQGINVLEEVKKSYPNVYNVVLSGMPTEAVRLLIPEKGLVNEYIRKRDLFKPSRSVNDFFIPTLLKAYKFSRKGIRSFSRPNTGYFPQIEMEYFGMKMSSDYDENAFIKEVHLKAHSIFESYLKDGLQSCNLWSSKLFNTRLTNKEIYWERLPIILGLRKMILHYIIAKNPKNDRIDKKSGLTTYKFNYADFKEKEGLHDLPNTLKSVVNTFLSFNLLEDKKDSCLIVLSNLLDEESDFVDNLFKRSESDVLLNFEKFKGFANFIDEVNKVFPDHFSHLDSVVAFQSKLSKLNEKLSKVDVRERKYENIEGTFPLSVDEIPSQFNDFKKIALDFFTIFDDE